MTDHYYSAKPMSASDRIQIHALLRGRQFDFETDSGVFSKSDIDYGSRLLIETMDIASNHNVLDMGCGYGPIGLAAAALAVHGHVTMVDINERAVQLSNENAKRNGLDNVTVKQSDLFAQLKGNKFDRIVTNPPIRAGKDIVYAIFEQSRQMLASQGQLWVVIQKKQGADSAFAKLQFIYSQVNEVARSKGYRIFKAGIGAE